MKLCLNCQMSFEKDAWVCPSCGIEPEKKDGKLLFSPELADENEGFDASFFDRLFKIEASSFWFCARNRLLIWALRNYFPEAKKFFEIGCGTGFVLSAIEKEFPELELCGSEIFKEGLKLAACRVSRANLFQADARKIPFQSEFDVIGAFDVMEHIREDSIVIHQMYQALKPGGGIIITVPQHKFLWSKIDEEGCHIRRYNKLDLKRIVEGAGFKVIKMTSFVSLLLPLVILSRFRLKLKFMQKIDEDIMAEFKIGTSLNSLLKKILDFEFFMIKLGIEFPIGSSLLLVALK